MGNITVLQSITVSYGSSITLLDDSIQRAIAELYTLVYPEPLQTPPFAHEEVKTAPCQITS